MLSTEAVSLVLGHSGAFPRTLVTLRPTPSYTAHSLVLSAEVHHGKLRASCSGSTRVIRVVDSSKYRDGPQAQFSPVSCQVQRQVLPGHLATRG